MEAGYLTSGFYVQAGYTHGPSFSDFFNYVEEQYMSSDNIGNFGGNVSMHIGYISRLSRNFALDIGFSIYGMSKSFRVVNRNPALTDLFFVDHELKYQSAIFTGTVPILLEFSPRQRIVPYVGIGLSIYSLRMDDYRDLIFATGRISEALRDTRTAAGGHFETGLAFKISRRLWIDLRGRWHAGNAHIMTLENYPADFEIRQTLSQYSLGIDYFFR
jgi:hypothetical protein